MPATSQISLVYKPAQNADSQKLEGPCEVGYLKLTAGGAPAHASVYDCVDINGANSNSLRWVLDSSTTGNDADHFDPPIVFKKGLFVQLDQGGGSNPEICVAVGNYLSN